MSRPWSQTPKSQGLSGCARTLRVTVRENDIGAKICCYNQIYCKPHLCYYNMHSYMYLPMRNGNAQLKQ